MPKKEKSTEKEKKPKRNAKATTKVSDMHINKALIDNFINLQKVMTNLAVKFDDLSNNIEKLLNLFEISAKDIASRNSNVNENQRESDNDFLQKLDSLLDQNKTISKGIMMMEERVRNRAHAPMGEPRFPSRPRPLPRH